MEKSKIIQGLMRLKNINEEELYELVKFDLSNGINFFDISDIYNDGECETKLGNVLKAHPELREKMIIQTKCGILKKIEEDVVYYDLSKEHIKEALKASLKRMNLTYVDYFLFHRPDIFFDAKEANETIKELMDEGLIKHFGVSNFNESLIEYIEKEETNPIKVEVNQLQLGLAHLKMIESVFNFNTNFNDGTYKSGEIFFYLKRKNIDLQSWSPFQVGMFQGLIFNDPKYKEVNDYLEVLAKKYNTNKSAIIISFLLMLGENVYVINGSTNKEHIKEALEGIKIKLLKEEWYTLYRKSGSILP